MIKYKRKVSIIAGESPAPIRLGQYDSDVVIELEIYATEGILEIEPDTAVTLKGTKPDGNGISVDGELTVKSDKRTSINTYIATINVIPQMTAVAGESRYKLSLTKDGKELNTGSFVIVIDRAAMDKDTLPSESVIKEIVDTIDRTDELLTAAKSIKTARKDIEKIRSVMDDVDSLKTAIDELSKTVGALRETAVSDIEQAKQAALKDVSESLAVLDNIEDMKTLIANATQSASADIAKEGEKIIVDMSYAKQNALNEISDSLTVLDRIDNIKKELDLFKASIDSARKSAVDDTAKAGKSTCEAVSKAKKEAVTELLETKKDIINSVAETGRESLKEISESLNALEKIKDVEDKMDQMKDTIDEAKKSVIEDSVKAGKDAADAVSKIKDEALEKIKEKIETEAVINNNAVDIAQDAISIAKKFERTVSDLTQGQKGHSNRLDAIERKLYGGDGQ